MKTYKVELVLNGFSLGQTYGKYRITGIKWAIRLGRKYQGACQNVPLEIQVSSRILPNYYRGSKPNYKDLVEVLTLKSDRRLNVEDR